MFVLSSPSGAGKTTISRKLLEQDRNIRMSVSVTTRAMRPGEVDGQDYSFVSREEFSRMTLNRELLEHAQVFDHYYGTPRKPVEQALETGHDVLFDIDWQGTRQLKRITREDMVSVFILPPSIGELERRLKSRAQDSDAVVANRMEKSIAEIRHWDEYDYVLINHDLDETSTKVSAILRAERLWRKRRHGLAEFVATLEQEALARDLGAA
jgi:guanylate kinase